VFESILEVGDLCELGFHTLTFERKNNSADEFSMTHKVIQQNKKIVESELPILIEGETGVGKTSLARKVHGASLSVGHFVHVNISSFSTNLLESELFGHVKGAFTGANTDKVGALKLSSGGTLFIDEIDSLPLEIQTKLLIFLDEQKIKPVGATFEEKIKTRIICASGKNLEQLVVEGKMRMDFYYRIASGLKITIPSLRDNPKLIEKFCKLYTIENKVSMTNKLTEFYMSLPWPGNIRQLKGHLDKKKLISNSTKLDFDELDDELLKLSSSLFSLDEEATSMTMEEVKIGYAKKIYYQCNKNLTLASNKLGISHKLLKRLIQAA
jgi:transcriptional regulator with PAS, ATPase and Fis domain